ncbi:peptidase [Streptomyces sp. NPDC001940]
MRPRIPLAVTAMALTSVVIGGPALAADPVGSGSGPREPTCSAEHPADFPIGTRIHGGPTTYHPGGGFRTWSLDLTNKTDAECAGIHPVLVLIDKQRTLVTRQIQLEFSDGGRQHRVRFERTDRDENIGVFDDGFPGFRVSPGKTVTVRARLAFTSDTRPNSVVANAAVVQRRDDDGDWVGESGDYRFTLTDEEKDEGGEPSGRPPGEASGRPPGEQRDEPGARDDGLLEPGRDSGTASGRPTDGPGPTTTAPKPTATAPDPTPSADTETGAGTGTDTGTGTGTGTEDDQGDHGDRGDLPLAPGELARTGPRSLRGLGLTSGALLVGGAALVAASRRLRTDRR